MCNMLSFFLPKLRHVNLTRHYDDKAAEVAQGFWNCPCVPMRERCVCELWLFLMVVHRERGGVFFLKKIFIDVVFYSYIRKLDEVFLLLVLDG
jgi:hypothetical protein